MPPNDEDFQRLEHRVSQLEQQVGTLEQQVRNQNEKKSELGKRLPQKKQPGVADLAKKRGGKAY